MHKLRALRDRALALIAGLVALVSAPLAFLAALAAAPIVSPGRGTDLLPRRLAGFIFEDAERGSVVQQLSRREDLPGSGVAIPVMTGRPVAGWVAEGGRKPVSDATVGTRLMDPKKLAVIVPFSREFLRNDRTNLFTMLRPKIAEAFAEAFDLAALLGVNTPFTRFAAETTNVVALGASTPAQGGVYKDLVNAIAAVASSGRRRRLTGWAFADTAEPILLGSVDANGRPILTQGEGTIGNSLLGRPMGYTDALPAEVDNDAVLEGLEGTVGIAGDWRKTAYGVGSDIEYSISEEASIELANATVLHLWQDNLVALRAEAEYGWVMDDVQAMVRLRDAAEAG